MNSKIKGFIAKWFVKSGALQFIKTLQGRKHIILSFHQVWPAGMAPDPFDSCPGISVDVLREILLYAKQHYNVVSLHTLCKNRNANRPLASITFDDGWRDNYDTAFPILCEMGIPVTFFITVGKIGSSEPFWQQKLGKSFHTMQRKLGLDEQDKFRKYFDITSQAKLDKNLYIETVEKWKSMSMADIQAKFKSSNFPVQIPSEEKRLFLNGEEIHEMMRYGMEFGSHTVNHVILPRESDSVVESELSESKKALEEIVGSQIDMLAYPNGNVSERVIRIAQSLGYKVGCTTHRAAVRENDRLLMLPRIEMGWDLLSNDQWRFSEFMFAWKTR